MITIGRNSTGSDGSGNDGDDGEESVPAIETVLRNDRRRDVLAHLSARDGEADMASIALHLAASEDETLSAIIEELHEHHLPKLAAHDLLRYESGGIVTLLIEPDRAEALVARADDEAG